MAVRMAAVIGAAGLLVAAQGAVGSEIGRAHV